MKRVSLREFNRNWADVIASVEKGTTVELTRRGETIARLVPAGKRHSNNQKSRAVARLFAAFDKVASSVRDGPPYQFDRDEIYEERTGRYR